VRKIFYPTLSQSSAPSSFFIAFQNLINFKKLKIKVFLNNFLSKLFVYIFFCSFLLMLIFCFVFCCFFYNKKRTNLVLSEMELSFYSLNVSAPFRKYFVSFFNIINFKAIKVMPKNANNSVSKNFLSDFSLKFAV
jgi:hypothetical protein